MIHHVPTQLKFKRLVRLMRPLLGDSNLTAETVAVGILERLWHATIANAIQGNIGKLSDDDIAEAVGWLGDASALVGALVDAGWVDRCEVHRLVVHDWHEHAPDFVRGNLSKHNRKFAIATCNGQAAIAPCSKHAAEATIPNLTRPNLTELTDQTKPDGKPASAVSQEFLIENWDTIREIAKNISNAIDPGRRLSKQNRELAIKVACMASASEKLCTLVDKQLGVTKEKLASASPPQRPWGWFKSRIIKAVNDSGESFDLLWDSIEIPADILERRRQPA